MPIKMLATQPGIEQIRRPDLELFGTAGPSQQMLVGAAGTTYSHLTMTTENHGSESLTEALRKAGIPTENHTFIREITIAVGAVEYRTVENSSTTYIRAKRRDDRPDLHIYWGFTNGFSEEELARIAPGATRKPSSRKPTWYVEHPVTRVHSGNERSRSRRREADFCSCGMQLSLTGQCANCD